MTSLRCWEKPDNSGMLSMGGAYLKKSRRIQGKTKILEDQAAKPNATKFVR